MLSRGEDWEIQRERPNDCWFLSLFLQCGCKDMSGHLQYNAGFGDNNLERSFPGGKNEKEKGSGVMIRVNY